MFRSAAVDRQRPSLLAVDLEFNLLTNLFQWQRGLSAEFQPIAVPIEHAGPPYPARRRPQGGQPFVVCGSGMGSVFELGRQRQAQQRLTLPSEVSPTAR